jgi:hypothetical protein
MVVAHPTVTVFSSLPHSAASAADHWYDPNLTELVAVKKQPHPVATLAANKEVVIGDEVDMDPSLCTGGPSAKLSKLWGVQLPDTVVELIPLCDVEEDRERRRKHPDAPLHSTRSRFVREIGLQDDAEDGTTLVDPDTGRNLLNGLDDSKRSYYGYPEDAAWIAFFAGAGRPLEDYGWLKAQVFVDDETVALVDARLTEDSGAAATALRANTSSSQQDVATSIVMAKWSVASSSTSPHRQQSKTAREELMSTYRLSCSKQRVEEQLAAAAVGGATPIFYSSGGAPAESPVVHHGTDATDGAVVELFPAKQQVVAAADNGSAPSPSTPMVPHLSVDAVLQQRTATLSTTLSSTHSSQHPGPSPLGSYDKRRIAQLTSPEKFSNASETQPSSSGADISTPEFPPSAFVSIPITDRYRPTPSPSSSSGAAIAAMPPIKSGREYRNHMRSKFMERKEKGMIAPATILPRTPHPPTTGGESTPSRGGDAAASHDVSLLISPAAKAILDSADPVPEA